MTKQTDNTHGTNKPQVVEYGYWPFFRAWLITFAILAPIILIFKYWFKLI